MGEVRIGEKMVRLQDGLVIEESVFKESYESMFHNIMYSLFDYGDLMIDNKKKLNLFRNEIGSIIRETESDLESSLRKNESENTTRSTVNEGHGYVPVDVEVRCFLGNNAKIIDIDGVTVNRDDISLTGRLRDLMDLMYDEFPAKRKAFMNRAKKLMSTEYDLHFGPKRVYPKSCNCIGK